MPISIVSSTNASGEDSFSRLQLQLCLEPCLLTSGPQAAGFRFLIYATKISQIYVTFFFFFKPPMILLTFLFTSLLLLTLESTKRVGRGRGFWKSLVTYLREWAEGTLADFTTSLRGLRLAAQITSHPIMHSFLIANICYY